MLNKKLSILFISSHNIKLQYGYSMIFLIYCWAIGLRRVLVFLFAVLEMSNKKVLDVEYYSAG